MKRLLLVNPGISSLNLGDEIISDGVKNQLAPLIDKSFTTEVSSHTSISLQYMKAIGDCDLKFVCGSNLLMGKLNGRFRQWDINFKYSRLLKDSILVGVGWWQYGNNPNLYTRYLYKQILSNRYIHSVRDSYTESMLKGMGFQNVINTGCATMWCLTPEHCKEIPHSKSENVVFTLTDYNKNSIKDKEMIDILLKNYENVYCWLQGTGDLDYLKSLIEINKINLIKPKLIDFDNYLENNPTDYIGTRLHAGIRALQKQKRSIIIGVDNRALEKQKDFNINCLKRDSIEELDSMIKSEFETKIILPLDNINKWKNQFKEY